jgi:hypothetical protein
VCVRERERERERERLPGYPDSVFHGIVNNK